MKKPFTKNIYEKNNTIFKMIVIFLLVSALSISLTQNYDVISMLFKKNHYDSYIAKLEQKKDEQGMLALKNMNSDFIAWIKIDDLDISLPIVSTDSTEKEDYYITHDFDKKENDFGCPYQRYNCSIGSTDNTILVAHSAYNVNFFGNVSRQSIFGKLSDYLYYNDSYNYNITVQTLDATYTYKVCATFKYNTKYPHEKQNYIYNTSTFSSESEYNNFVSYYSQYSFINNNVSTTYGDKFLTLYTCYTGNLDYRVMIVAKQISQS